MNDKTYVVATIRPWNIQAYNDTIRHYPGRWHLVTRPGDLNPESIRCLNPRYIFFPHWNHIVPGEILALTECVCFHETDLPFGRGGSPVQNLIQRGYKETVVSAFRMTEDLDAGPVYMKRPLCLQGLAEEIFVRTSQIVAGMIRQIAAHEPMPVEQARGGVSFKRRIPEESEITEALHTLAQLFDHIRMLDAEGYPKAFIENGRFRFEISRPALRTDFIAADIRITQRDREEEA